jgi:hypothetical protein
LYLTLSGSEGTIVKLRIVKREKTENNRRKRMGEERGREGGVGRKEKVRRMNNKAGYRGK